MSLEDELAVLDLRYAELLKRKEEQDRLKDSSPEGLVGVMLPSPQPHTLWDFRLCTSDWCYKTCMDQTRQCFSMGCLAHRHVCI
jgi:hypothetical protein